MNRLPEKLLTLRKHFGYAQGDVAQKMQVPLTEYMNWENGNKICSISQLVELAKIFEVTADMLVDNTKEIVLPEQAVSTAAPAFAIDPLDTRAAAGGETTVQLNTTAVLNAADTAANTIQFEATRVQQIVDTTTINTSEEQKKAAEAREAKRAARRKQRMEEEKRKKKMMLYGGIGAAALVLVALLAILFWPKSGSALNTLGDTNRIALGDTYSLFINRNGNLVERGSFNPKESFDNVVQVSAYGNHALGLKADGKVVSSDANAEVDAWEDITMIAAGAEHSVGLVSDGTVVCTGDDNACEVSHWTDIKAVYAGDAVTVGVKTDGSVVTSGYIDGAAANQSDVSSVAIGKSGVVVVKKDGTAVGYGSDLDSVKEWKNIKQAVVGNGFAVGLKDDHTLVASTGDIELGKKLASWTNVRYLAADGKTVIAYNGNEKMYGAGDNEYGQYVVTAEEKKEDAKKLDSVKPASIKVSATTVNVSIKWDSVENADSYDFRMDTDPETKVTVNSNQTSVNVENLEDGKEYTIEIIANPKEDEKDKYEASEPVKYKYTYKSVAEQLGPVKHIDGEIGNGDTWILHWDAVEHADHYIVTLDGGAEQSTISNTITLALEGTNVSNGTTHNITVKACSDSTAYTESEVSKAQLTYTVVEMKYNVQLSFRIQGEADSLLNAEEIARVPMGEVYAGVYDITKYLPDGYMLPYTDMYTVRVPEQINDGVVVIPVTKFEPAEPDTENKED